MKFEYRQCQCEVCRRMRSNTVVAGDRWKRDSYLVGKCDLCGDPNPWGGIAPWVPDLVKEFFGVSQVCNSCKNGIFCHAGFDYEGRGWGLCWKDSPDAALKWAMVSWLRYSHFGRYEFKRIECRHQGGDFSPMRAYNDQTYP